MKFATVIYAETVTGSIAVITKWNGVNNNNNNNNNNIIETSFLRR
jgi:hypothetical protein